MKYISRKNDVFDEIEGILKRFQSPESKDKEKKLLQELYSKGVRVPRIIHETKNELLLEKIEGLIYAEALDELGEKEARSLVDWHEAYYRTISGKRGDINLRNYIFNEEGCVGIDFEEGVLEGTPEEDYGRQLAFIVSYDPCCNALRRTFIKAYLESLRLYDRDLKKIKEWAFIEYEAMEKRRGYSKEKKEGMMSFLEEII